MQRCTRLRTCFFVAMLGLAAGGTCQRSSADVEETEIRLRAAGVEEPVRGKIHEAIERAASFLIARQAEEGAFGEHWQHGKRPVGADPIQTTLLCALALRQVGTTATEAPVQRALTWALAQDPEAWGAIHQNVRSAGLALMLGDATPDPRLRVRITAQALGCALDDATGYWSHALSGREGRLLPGLGDCQFAILGLWCARRQGVEVPAAVWERHARALGQEQTKTGSWRWHPDRTLAALGHPADPSVDTGIPIGRYIGLANLLLASAALKDSRVGQSRLKLSIKRAVRQLGSDTAALLEDPAGMLVTATDGRGREWRYPRPQGSLGRPGEGAYRTLWALEQACLFAGVEHYVREATGSRGSERRSWYLDATEWLLRVQDASGGWSPTAGNPVTPPSEIDTAYAVLFLVRSPSSIHPTAPRPVESTPRGAERPGDSPPDGGR